MSRPTFRLLALASALGLVLAPLLIALAPDEVTMGLVQRIFYYHVPMAWLTFLSAFLAAAGAAWHLGRRSRGGEALARVASELVVVCGLCVLVTGPLWARQAWGTWWVWRDIRLVATLVLWLAFVASIMVRRLGGQPRLASGVALFAVADVPLVYLSVFFWRTHHPEATVVSTLDPAMRPAFFLSLTTFTLLYLVVLALALALERTRLRLDDAHLAAQQRAVRLAPTQRGHS